VISTKTTLSLAAIILIVTVGIGTPVFYAFEEFTIETPLPPYAFLTIDISEGNPFYPGYGKGLSIDTIHMFDDVMKVENNVTQTGASVICVIITSQMDGLRFYHSNTTPKESISFTLGEYESVNVGIYINTTNHTLGEVSGSFKIQAYEGECE